MQLDHFVTLGRSGLRVSPFALGTMTFGEDWGWGSSVAESEAILAAYLDRGGNHIDTANIYTAGHSEKIIGDYLARQPGRRDRLVIGTKFFANLFAGDPNGGGAGRKSLIAALEASLRRLQTDYIDLYWIHNWDRGTPIEETLRTLDDLVRAGKIRYVGFSDLPGWKVGQAQTLATLRGWAPAIAMQLEYSLIERTGEGELVPAAQELGLGLMPWSPLKSGWLSGKFSRTSRGDSTRAIGAPTERDWRIIDQVAAVAKQLDTSSAQVAISWVHGRPGVASTLVGARTVAQLNDNLAALTVALTPAQRASLDEVSKPTLNFPFDNNAQLGPILQYAGAHVDGVQTSVMPRLIEHPTRY